MEYMLSCAPGSVYRLEVIDRDTGLGLDPSRKIFHCVFWCFKQCVEAFNHCKPIIQIDGTHLYGKYRHTLLIATTQDGDSAILPLAYAIVEGETLEAWSWFLRLLREHVTQRQEICAVSDRHRSIIQAVTNDSLGWQPPYAYHVFCLRHIVRNFNHKFKNQELKKMFIKIGYNCCKSTFDRQLERFHATSPEVARWIDEIPLEQWSIEYDKYGRRYGHMTTNLSEAVNKVLKGARNLPITALVKYTYVWSVNYFVERGTKAIAALTGGARFTAKWLQVIAKNQEDACTHQVINFNIERLRFEVEEPFNPSTNRGGQTWRVNLATKYCQCGKFRIFRHPCSHAIAACAKFSIDFSQYIDRAYQMNSLVTAYSGQWFLIGDEEIIPHNGAWTLTLDASRLRGHGRPKSTRIQNEMDWVESQPRQRCRHCNQIGHNQRRCPNMTQQDDDED